MISVVIPCFNSGKYLPETINSILAQKYTDYEILIVDDGSNSQSTLDLLFNLNKLNNISVYFQQKKGVSSARNFGASISKGDFLIFLDADDLIHEMYFEAAIEIFHRDSNIEYVYCDLQEFGISNVKRKTADFDLKSTLLSNPSHISGIVKKSLWLKIGGFDLEFVNGWEDWEYHIRLIKNCKKFTKIKETYFFYRISLESRERSLRNHHKIYLENMIFKKHLLDYLIHYPMIISQLRKKNEIQQEINNLKISIHNIYHSLSYRIGNFFLFPLKLIRKILNV